MKAKSKFWFLVRDAANVPNPKSQALYLWLSPVDGIIHTNRIGFPVGIQLRPVADRLKQLGYCNGKGKPYHPYQVQEMVVDGFCDAFCAVEDLELTDDQRRALKAAFIDGCRHKRIYEHVTEEEECWRSWKKVKRPTRRVIPWDREGER
jgi:hypothetical protein